MAEERKSKLRESPSFNKTPSYSSSPNPSKRGRTSNDSNSLGKHLLKTSTKELSKKLSSMKFMRRTFEIENKEKDLKESKKMIAEAHWVVKYSNLPIEKPKIKVEQDPCFFSWGSTETRTAGGRQSFGKFNPTIENLEIEKRREVISQLNANIVKAISISTEEMADIMEKNKSHRS